MKFAFWEDLPSPLKPVFYFFTLIFLVAVLYALYCSFMGYNIVIDWELVGQRMPVKVEVMDISVGLFDIPLLADNYVITQWYQGSDIQVNLFATYFFLAATILALVLAITSSTFLSKFPYIVITLMFMLCMVFFKFDDIELFGWQDTTALVLVVVSYLALSYLFNSIKTYFDFIQRFKMFMSITIIWGLVIYFFSEVERPFVLLAANGSIVPFLIGALFIVSIAHEIIHFIVIALTRTEVRSGNNFTHFTFFSLLYLLNVLLLYLHDTRVIDWSFPYLNPYVLVSISSVLGLWGMQSRAALIEKDSRKYPLLIFLYLAGAICCFGSICYFMGNANDSILQVVKDVIIYSHLGFGIVFFFYVLANFKDMLRSDEKVYQVIYSPTHIPHFTFRFGGVILITIGFLYHDIKIPSYQTLSGMFNNLGDYYKITGQNILSETYFENARVYGYRNHKSNYSLAKIKEKQGQPGEAVEYYRDATLVRPSQMAFANLGNTYMADNDLFNSIFALNDGLLRYPNGTAILNNKGVLFSKTNMSDSALLYFDASDRSGDDKKASVTNYLALLASSSYGFDPDSLMDQYHAKGMNNVGANVLLLRNLYGKTNSKFEHVSWGQDLNIYSASTLINYLINQYKFYDTTELRSFEQIALNPKHAKYRESLDYARAMALYRLGFVDEAIDILRNLGVSYSKGEGYLHTLGLIFMDLGDFRQAKSFFELALAKGYQPSFYPLEICNLELIEYDIDSIQLTPGGLFEMNKINSKKWLSTVRNPNPDWQELGDLDKKAHLHYNRLLYGQDQFENYSKSIESSSIRADILLEEIERLLKKDDLETASGYFDLLLSLNLEDEIILNQVKVAELKWAAATNDLVRLETLLSEIAWIPFDRKWHYQALINQKNEGMELDVDSYFEVISTMNSFNEEAIIAAAKYFQTDENDRMKSYNILVDALLQNPFSIKLLKEYIIESTEVGLKSYADRALLELEALADPEDFNNFSSVVNNLKMEVDLQ